MKVVKMQLVMDGPRNSRLFILQLNLVFCLAQLSAKLLIASYEMSMHGSGYPRRGLLLFYIVFSQFSSPAQPFRRLIFV